MDLVSLEEKSKEIRRNVIKMLANAGSGHPAGSLGMADIFTALYFDTLNISKDNYNSLERDYLFLSNGHICPVLYATLAEAEFFPKSELMTLRKLNSRLQGHPHIGLLPGVENSGGPLGQGISMAVGAALALKSDKKENKVFCVCGDGELNEGQVWEAILLANKYSLDNLTIIIDKNDIQLDGPTKDIMPMENLKERFVSFGMEVFETDGHNLEKIVSTLNQVVKFKGKTKIVIANTIAGKGVSFMEKNYKWHGKAPSKEEAEKAIMELS